MPKLIEGQRFLTSGEIQKQLQISRTTLWRWRKEGQVPAGNRFRTGEVLFTEEEALQIREHANRMEPVDTSSSSQLRLFNGS